VESEKMNEFNEPEVTSDEIINDIIPLHFKTGQSLMFWGSVGAGKTEVKKQATQHLAKQMGKEFLSFTDATQEEQESLLNPETLKKYCLFCVDMLTFKADTTDLKGALLLNEHKGYMQTTPPLMYKILSMKEATGVLLFDELNQASQQISRASLQIILEKRIDTLKLSRNILILACGNAITDAQDVEELDTPNKNRFRHYRFKIDLNQWQKYAIANRCHNAVIGFIMAYPDQLNNIIPENNAFNTPRSVFLFGKTLNHMEKGEGKEAERLYFKRVEREASASCGKAWATQFINHFELSQSVDVNAILKNPSLFNDLEDIGKEYATVTAIAEKVKQDSKLINDVVNFCAEITRKEYGGLLINLMTEQDKTITTKFSLSPNFAKFYEVYKGVFAQ
jgi:hypothetical protein